MMRRAFLRTGALLVALVCMVVANPRGARAQVADEESSSDGDALRSLWSLLDATWNERDVERFSDLFTVEASFEFVDRGQSLEGRATIRRHFAERFPRFAADVRHHTTVREIRVIAPDVRTVDGKVEILRTARDGGTESTVLRTFAIFAVMIRSEERWRIRVLRVYQLPAATGVDHGSSNPDPE